MHVCYLFWKYLGHLAATECGRVNLLLSRGGLMIAEVGFGPGWAVLSLSR
jgi:hypothetical protein